MGKTSLVRRFVHNEALGDEQSISCGQTMEYHALLPWQHMEELGIEDEEACGCAVGCCDACAEPRDVHVTIRDIHGRYDGHTQLEDYRGVDCFLFCFSLRDGGSLDEAHPADTEASRRPSVPRGALGICAWRGQPVCVCVCVSGMWHSRSGELIS